MHENISFRLLLKNKIFFLPPNFQFLSYINSDIYRSLVTNHKYQVKSDVHKNTLENFLDYLINKKVPVLNYSNIREYELLSTEFDIMKSVLITFKKYFTNHSQHLLYKQKQKLINKLKEKTSKKEELSQNYQKIIYYYFNENHMFQQPQLLKSDKLESVCRKSNVEHFYFLIQLKIEINDFLYVIDKSEKKATIVQYIGNDTDLLIPRSFQYKNEDYIITRIHQYSFYNLPIRSIDFPTDSELQTIEKFAFYDSKLEFISIPSSLTKIDEEWCIDADYITQFNIKPNNPNFMNLRGEMILGKSDPSTDSYDIILLARRNIKEVIIPSFVRRIAPSAFLSCKSLYKITFTIDSQLESIGHFAFSRTSIETITMPPSINEIGKYAFFECEGLFEVIIPYFSQIQSFSTKAFVDSTIECISLPCSALDINMGPFYQTASLTDVILSVYDGSFDYINDGIIVAKSNPFSSIFDVIFWVPKNIKYVKVPSFIKKIGPMAFDDCIELLNIEFDNDSQLETIRKKAFCCSPLSEIIIPSSLKYIGKSAFTSCFDLNKVEFKDDSQLVSIGSKAFIYNSITSFYIPKHVNFIGYGAFFYNHRLLYVEIAENSELRSINLNIFDNTSNAMIFIPVEVKDSIQIIR